MLYFDHNATSPLCAAAREAWLEATERYIGNPSSPHRLGQRAEKALDEAREKLAGWLGCRPGEIVWTSGATESVNMAVRHLAQAGKHALISPLEHPCLLRAAEHWCGTGVGYIALQPTGALELEQLAEAVALNAPSFVAVMAANNETGALLPWREVNELCRAARISLLCDAAQWIGKLPAKGLGDCDFVAGCAHKFGGPQGVGFLKVSGSVTPYLHGGGQEEGRRAGTENVAGILAMIAALETREASTPQAEWRDEFIAQLRREHGSGIQIVAESQDRLWNTVSVVMPEVDCRQRWVVKLDKLGFAVSTGSACASGKEKPSHVLTALGYSPALASRVLRFSSGWDTTRDDWQQLLAGIRAASAEMRETGPPLADPGA